MRTIRNMLCLSLYLILLILTLPENAMAQMVLKQIIIGTRDITNEKELGNYLTVIRYGTEIKPRIDMPLEKNDRIRTGNTEVKLIIGGAKVFLGRGTRIIIIEPNIVELIEGELFIDKIKRVLKSFSVQTQFEKIMTKGTKFYVGAIQKNEPANVIVFEDEVILEAEKYRREPKILDSKGNNAFFHGAIMSSYVSIVGYEDYYKSKILNKGTGDPGHYKIGDSYGSSTPSVGGSGNTLSGVTMPAMNDSILRQLRDLKKDIKNWVGKYGIYIEDPSDDRTSQTNNNTDGYTTPQLNSNTSRNYYPKESPEYNPPVVPNYPPVTQLSLNEFGISMPLKKLYKQANIGKQFTGKVINADKANKIFTQAFKGQQVIIIYRGEGQVSITHTATGETVVIEIAE